MASIKQVVVGGTTYDIKATYDGSGNTIASYYLPLSGGTMTGNLILKKTSSISTNDSSKLTFKITQSDNNITSTAYIAVYDDHDTGSYGTNMVIQSAGNVIIGGGEGPNAFYTENLVDSTSENLYLASDGNTYIYTNCNTIANKKLAQTIDTTGRTAFLSYNGTGFYGRNISYGTAAPSGGSAGDVYIQYS